MVLLTGLSGATLPAFANPPATLQPIQSASMVEALAADSPNDADLAELANQINHRLNQADQPDPSIVDVLPLPFLDDILDDEGNLELPMGLTVYNTMGDTSVGFSSKF
ncbi:MAG: hypothetical protein HC929_24965 [Leptolyngbyaceae cyanobacterium SM2_5_2]|nr:hypothetical protein [Leptolyngbyaceae cyanobacterium SM2_5_2]